MTEEPARLPANLRPHRERVVEALTQHFAKDHLDTESFEKRLDHVYAAASIEELQVVLRDLPALTDAPVQATAGRLARPEDVRPRQTVLALMGGSTKKGDWTPARKVDAVAIMGGVELDFRDSRFAPGVTEVSAFALMGGIEIIVPPNIRVECDGFGLMGGFEGISQEGTGAGPDQPTLRITGAAIMGGVEIFVRHSGESAKEARKREREERKRGRGNARGCR